MYEILELQAYYNNSKIIFNVKVPILHTDNYITSHIIPLPVNVTRQIITPQFVVYNNVTINYCQNTCLKIENTYEYICKYS